MGRETYTGDVAFEVRGHLGLITLNRPKALNSLTELMCESIRVQLEDWADDGAVAQVLIRGAGERGLCAGGDVLSFYYDMVQNQPLDGGPLLPDGAPAYRGNFSTEGMLAAEYAMNWTIAQYAKPYIALMDGVVLGGGVGISAHGSHRIVTERSRIGMPETTIGFSPDVGGSYLLSRAPGGIGLHAGLTSANLSGADAIYAGLADVCVTSDRLEDLTQALTKDAVNVVLPQFTEDPGESSVQASRTWIDDAYSGDTLLEVLTRLQELSADEPGAAEALQAMRDRSPTMLAVAFHAIGRAAGLSLQDALSQEYTVALHAIRSHDFREGIRAQLVDKDRSPRWRPESIEQVDPALRDQYFKPIPGKRLTL